MPRPPEQSFRIAGKGFDWEKEYEFTVNTKKLHDWMHSHNYNGKDFNKLAGIGSDRGRFAYARGVMTLFETKRLALLSGMSLYDFIDIFLSDIYPVSQEDFNIVSEEETNST